MQKIASNDLKDLIKKIFLIILGSLILAIAINLFVVPNKLLSGGISGIGLIDRKSVV